jgi:hypothetical protein
MISTILGCLRDIRFGGMFCIGYVGRIGSTERRFRNNITSMDSLKDRLSRYRQIKLTVVGRKSGKTITNPIWFVAEGQTLYLLPVHGYDTQWYQNVLKNPQIRIDARDAEIGLGASRSPNRTQ